MKTLAAVAMLALSLPAFAQSSAERPGANSAKDQRAAPQEGNPAFEAGAGSSAERAKSATFTHGESKRCESLTGNEKALCDKEEGTKAEGEEAERLSKTPVAPRK
ncbi:MAG TPA: hypothetical protein VE325_09390 [Burkholderiales bacterium]|nr:hypothetical protein [Burkholderiales bacterium]